MIISVTFNLLSANAFNLVWSKMLSCGNGLTLDYGHHTLNLQLTNKIYDRFRIRADLFLRYY